MYIYKMVFIELDEMNADVEQFLRDNKVIVETDYNTTEIMADVLQEFVNHVINNPDIEINNPKGITIDDIKDLAIGGEVFDALMNNEIDLAMCV